MKTRLSADFADSRRLKSERVGSTGRRIPQADAKRMNNSLNLFEPLRHPAPAAPVAAPPRSLRASARWLRSACPYPASGEAPDGLRARRKPRLNVRNDGTSESRFADRQCAAS